ncbi:UNVERIFIED_CONTAM: hypothetical protein FKN15_078533 [Acipenser sinensis]
MSGATSRKTRSLCLAMLVVCTVMVQLTCAHEHGHAHSHGGHAHSHGGHKHGHAHSHGGHEHGHAHSHGGHGHDCGHAHHGGASKWSAEANLPLYEEAEGASHHGHSHGATSQEEHISAAPLREKTNTFELWTQAVGATLLISAAPFLILFLIPVESNTSQHQSLLKVLLSFASGGLLGDAFLHLIPHALRTAGVLHPSPPIPQALREYCTPHPPYPRHCSLTLTMRRKDTPTRTQSHMATATPTQPVP